MNVNDVVKTITIRGTSEGIDKLTSDLKGLASAQKDVAVASDDVGKRSLSLEGAWKKQTLRLDENARAQANIARETKVADSVLREGLITQQQHAERLNLIAQRYAVATTQSGKFAKQTGLTQYELLNLSRQVQDVGVSLAGGQSPFVVLTQQGSQIFDVFQSSQGSVKGFFNQIASGAASLLTPMRALVGGLIGGFGAVTTALVSSDGAQAELQRSLSATGRFAQVTTGDLKALGRETSSAFGLSVKEGREAAAAFAHAGVETKKNIGDANRVALDFAKTLGVDLDEGVKILAKDLTSGAAGIEDLSKRLGGVTAAQQAYLSTLDASLDKTKFQAAAIKLVADNTKNATDLTSGYAKTWREVTNVVSNVFDKIGGPPTARTAATINSEIVGLEDRRERSQRTLDGGGLGPRATTALRDSIAEDTAKIGGLRMEMSKLNDQDLPFARMGKEALTAAQSFAPLIQQAVEYGNALKKIEEARANPAVRGGLNASQNRQLDVGSDIGKVLKIQTEESAAVAARMATSVLRIRDNYKGVSTEAAFTLDRLKDQLSVAQAFGGRRKLDAQDEAKIAELRRTGRQDLVDAGVVEAERAVTNARINDTVKEQTRSIRDQTELLRAGSIEEQARIAAAQAYRNAIRDGASSTEAAGLRAAVLANGLAQAAKAADAMADAMERAYDSAFVANIGKLGGTINSVTNSITTPQGSTAAPGPGFKSSLNAGYDLFKQNENAREAAKVTLLTAKAGSNLYDDVERMGLNLQLLAQKKTALSKELELKVDASPASLPLRTEYGAKQAALDIEIQTLKKQQADKAVEAQAAILNARAGASNIYTDEKTRTQFSIDALRLQLGIERDPTQRAVMQTQIDDLIASLNKLTDSTDKLTTTLPSVLSSLYSGGNVKGLGFADGGMVPANTNFMYAEHSPSGPQFGRTGPTPLFITPGTPSGGAKSVENNNTNNVVQNVTVLVRMSGETNPNDPGFRAALGRSMADAAKTLNNREARG